MGIEPHKELNTGKWTFVGFEPKERVKVEARLTVDRLLWDAPSDSAIELILEKKKGHYSSRCRVASPVGVFEADSHSQYALSSLKILEGRLKKQLGLWKNNRPLDTADFLPGTSQRVS